MRIRYCVVLFFVSALSGVSFSITSDQLKKSIESMSEIEQLLERLPDAGFVEELKETSEIIQRIPLWIQGFVFYTTASDEDYKNVTGMDPADRLSKLEQMQRVFASLNKKLDSLDSPITSKAIEWKRIDNRVPAVRKNLFSLAYSLNMAFTAPRDANPIFIRMFRSSYQSHESATKQLKSLMLREGNPLEKNIFDKAREYLKNDPTQMQLFVGFYVRLFIRSLIIDFAYFGFNGDTIMINKWIKDWNDDLEALKTRVQTTDRAVKDSWTFQYVTDVDELGEKAVKESSNNKLIASNIYNFLSKKYTQRTWFVLVHDYTEDSDKDRYYDNCKDYINRFGSKKVVVNSLDAKQIQPMIEQYKIFENIESDIGPYSPKAYLAQILYDLFVKMSCDKRKFVGAIESKADPRYYAAGNHAYKRTVLVSRHFHINSKPYDLIAFA